MTRASMPLDERATPTRAGPPPQSLIADRGARATRTRVQTLGVLLAAHEALTHHEIERRVKRGHDVDRVTLYRVLEWLVEQGLAHKIAGEDRVWRYSAAGHGSAAPGTHAHFQCSDCGRVVCLDDASVPAVSLPRGFRRREVEVTVRGSCDDCGK